jgi:hypothetical protein
MKMFQQFLASCSYGSSNVDQLSLRWQSCIMVFVFETKDDLLDFSPAEENKVARIGNAHGGSSASRNSFKMGEILVS